MQLVEAILRHAIGDQFCHGLGLLDIARFFLWVAIVQLAHGYLKPL